MRIAKCNVTGQQATDIVDYDLATALRQSLELAEVPDKLDETDRSLSTNAVRALRSCYADLVRETKAGLHDLYESTVAEIRLAYTGVAGMPDERGVEAGPGRGQVPAAGSDKQNGDPLREHGRLIHPCAPGISIEISANQDALTNGWQPQEESS